MTKPVTVEWIFNNSIPEPNSGCWLWESVDRSGYGRISIGRGKISAHRCSYELHCGEIPMGMELDHLCRVRCCVNPHHLEPVTRHENMKRSKAWDFNRTKTLCPAGHPYSGDNLYLDKNGKRSCRTCNNARSKARDPQYMRDWHAKRRAKFTEKAA